MRRKGLCCSGRHGWIGIVAGVLASLYAAHGGKILGGKPVQPFEVEVQGEGPAVVLIPGLNSTGEVWKGTVERLRESYEFHVLTLAGFGGVPAADGPFLSTVRDGILRYIDAEGLEKPVIVGHSLGGLLAFSVAAAAPNAVSGVVSVDGVPFLPALLQPGASVESIRPQAEAMRDFLSSAGADQLAQQARSAGLATGAASLDLLARMAAKSDPEASAEAVYEVMTTDLRPEVAKIQAPALLIAAGAGAQTPEAREQLMERYESQIRPLPDHRVVLAEGARHFVMLDSPESFNDTLRSFLDGLPKPSPLPEAP